MPFQVVKDLGNDFLSVFTGVDKQDFAEVDLQESFFKQLLDYSIERGYLNEAADAIGTRLQCDEAFRPISWIRLERLPVNPSNSDDYDLLSRWKGSLSALHAWGQRLVFLLLRYNGETSIFLGTGSPCQEVSSSLAADQMRQAMSGSMPGIELMPVLDKDVFDRIGMKLLNMNSVGAITGIPSARKTGSPDGLQTLDSLAFGLHGSNGDRNLALVVVADPIRDDEIADIISQYRSTGNDIHNFVKQTVSNAESKGNNSAVSLGTGTIVKQLMRFAGAMLIAGETVATGGLALAPELFRMHMRRGTQGNVGLGGGLFVSRSYSHNLSQGVNTEYLNKFAQYAEELIDKHVDRLKKGRNYGFWNTGVYVLGPSDSEVNTAMGMLRTIYSGDESFIEPIRLHRLHGGSDSVAVEMAKTFRLIPLPSDFDDTAGGIWHPLGRHYQYLSTPLNTEELSIATSLPRKDVPGLRFVKTVVRFANNPAKVDADDVIRLGNIIDTGVVQKNIYEIDFNTLVKHTLISGTTGMGKSTTCRRVIDGVLSHGVPILVLDPAKDEYVRWAIAHNRRIETDSALSPEEKKARRFRIFMPGVSSLDGYALDQLRINPFEPGAVAGAPIDMLSHCEQLVAILNASLPTSDVLPIIIDEAVYTYLNSYYYDGLQSGEMKQLKRYVKLEGLTKIAETVLKQRGYDKKVQDDLLAALKTRFAYLLRGKRGSILNVEKSTSFDILFGGNTVINLSRITAQKDKALIMALITLALYEYRISKSTYDDEYRIQAQQNRLMHLTVIEEAHNLLAKPDLDLGRSGDAQRISSEMFSNILSEIRSYGEGVMIVDQVPTKLIPDAIKNTNYKIVHRLVAPDDADLMAATLSLRGDQKELISSLGQGETIVFGDKDDAAAWVKIKQ